MKIAVMGAGGVGGYFGGLLAKGGEEVFFLARGEHLAALREHGLRVQAPDRDFLTAVKATDRPEEIGPVDLVLFCVKSYDTEAAAEAIAPLVGPKTGVLTLQNGVDNPTKLCGAVGSEHVLAGAARMESSLVQPGLVQLASKFADIEFAEWDGQSTERSKWVLATLWSAGIGASLSDNPRRTLWEKFLFLAPIAGMTSLTRLTIGEVMGCPETEFMYSQAVEEVFRVAVALGIPLPEDAVQRTLTFTAGLHPAMKTSMLRDLEQGRRLELEALSGMVVRLGRMLKVATPVHACIFSCLKPHDDRARQGQPVA